MQLTATRRVQLFHQFSPGMEISLWYIRQILSSKYLLLDHRFLTARTCLNYDANIHFGPGIIPTRSSTY